MEIKRQWIVESEWGVKVLLLLTDEGRYFVQTKSSIVPWREITEPQASKLIENTKNKVKDGII